VKDRDPTTLKGGGRERQEQFAGIFVVLGAALVFGPLIWLLERWREAVARDPASAWGAPWLGEHLSAHPYLTVGALLLFVTLSSGLVMLMLLGVSKWLAARLTDRARSD
jgi:hypothetical protein